MPSRLSRLEEKRTKKQLYTVSIGIVVLIIVLISIGIPLIIRVSVFLGNLKSSQPAKDSGDQTPPLAPILASILEATNSATIKIEGYAEPESNLKLYLNGSEVESVLVGIDGDFGFTDVILRLGDNTFYTIATDQAGNESPESEKQTIVYKKTGPQLEVIEPQPDQEFGKNFETIQVKGKTDVGVQVRINDRFVTVSDDGSFSFNLKLTQGENQITVKAFDTAGNQTEKQLKVTYKPE